MLSCIRCNQILNEGEKFCHLCGGLGRAVSQDAGQTSTLTKKKDTSSKIASSIALFKAIGGLCLFVVCLAIIILANEIFLRLTLTEANTGTVVYASVSVSGNESLNVHVAHYVNGERYSGRLRGIARGSWDDRRGTQVRIFYNPADPRQIRTNVMLAKHLFYVIMFVLFGSIFLITEIPRIKREWKEWE